ncbi:ABC transporter substrate-binding protein [Affinibrenneria salicis]|uniref:ABC transporter substrate-binding protein n=1 Tax=Affinibrenneria salicis TaxID=2590031 RepID=A0A5J5G4Q6_9GAMM|nr:ABC transporter substrate-binding protein [Affinibrenneria salicis]KAA9002029.1 ABC transporter substrate-binding protein [Affinibrenneria salicis]
MKKFISSLLKQSVASLIALMAVIASLSGPAQAGIRITDVLGRHVVLHKPAQRLVLGFYFEDYIAITGPGAIDRLVGISLNYWQGYRPRQYEAYLARFPAIAGLVDIGDVDKGSLSAEKIIAARPDAVILAASQFDYLGPAVEKIEAFGVPVVVVDYNAQTLEKHLASTRIIGQVMGSEGRAQQLATEYKTAVEDTERRVASAAQATKPNVYVELGQQGSAEYGNSYGKGMWAGVIDMAGGANIAAGKIAGWGPLTPEYVVASRPDVILVTGSEWMTMPNAVLMGFGIDATTTREKLRPYLARAGWNTLPAVRQGQVYAIYHGGTRTIYDYVYLRYIAKILYPQAFKDVEPQEELRRYYRTYLPLMPDGTFMLRLESRS